MRYVWTVALVFALGSVANAAEVGPCGDLDRISNLVGQTKSFSEGKIRIAHVDTDEPVCCRAHLLIFIPDPQIGSQCFAVSQRAARGVTSATGFSGIVFSSISAAYDPQRGLLLKVPYTLYDLEGGPGRPGTTTVRVDLRGEGTVAIAR